MGIIETIQAWLQPKDLSLILELETTDLFHFHLERLERKYGGRHLIIINGNETDDGKTRFYVMPAIRGKTGNFTWDEMKALYPKAVPLDFYNPREKDRIYA